MNELKNVTETKGEVSSKYEEINSANEKLVADHKVYEQLITDFSIKTRDNEKTQRAQLIKIAELGNKITVQQGVIDTLEASLSTSTAQLDVQTAKADRLTKQLDHVSMTNEDNEEWLRLRTATLINTSGYCRFIEEQLFNARRMAVTTNDALGNPVGGAGASQQKPGPDFTDMFNQEYDDEYADNMSNHTSIEQIESKITAMLEGIESRITTTLLEAGRGSSSNESVSDSTNMMSMIEQMESRLKSAVLDAIPSASSSAMEEKIKNAIIEASNRAITSISPTKAGASAGVPVSSMNEIMETMEERLNKLINDATRKLQNVVGVNPSAAVDSEYVASDSGKIDASPLVSKENRQLKQKVKAEAINARVQYEQMTSLLDDTAEELTILYHSKVVARNNIVKWSKDFTALCGYPPSRNDKDKSNVFVNRLAKELVAAQTEYKLKCDEYHQHVDEMLKRRAEMVDAYRTLESVAGSKQAVPDEHKPHAIKQMIVEDPFDIVELPNEKSEVAVTKSDETRSSEAVTNAYAATHYHTPAAAHYHSSSNHMGNQVEPNMKKISTSDSIPIKVSSSSSLLVSDREGSTTHSLTHLTTYSLTHSPNHRRENEGDRRQD